jgi:hypothetical protein
MKRWNLLVFALMGLAMPLIAITAHAAPPPFTNDFYAANPKQWLNKKVTLSVAYFTPIASSKFSVEKMEVMDAYTFHNHQNGGHINVAASPEVFARLKATCGTHVQREGGWIHITQIQGIYKEKDGQYYLQVEK